MKINRQGKSRTLSGEELDLIASYLPSQKHKLISLVLRKTAGRISEIVALKYENLTATTILIPKEINHKGLSKSYNIPDSLNDLAKKDEKGYLALKIVEIIGEDEPYQLDSETIFFVTKLLNKMDLVTIRNKVLNSALPLRT